MARMQDHIDRLDSEVLNRMVTCVNIMYLGMRIKQDQRV